MEIGSEYWKENRQYISDEETVYLSGRTALDVIIKDAVLHFNINRALLPSYCCHTMIEPFLRNGVEVRFYDVYVDDGRLMTDIPEPEPCEMLYIMKYFGNTDSDCKGFGRNTDRWCTTVEDLTHCCFHKEYKTKADYWFSSYRKWFAADGIAVAGKKGSHLPVAENGINQEYCSLRSDAFSLKNDYMSGCTVEKKLFLDKFTQAEQILENDYAGYGARAESVAGLVNLFEKHSQIHAVRRQNAEVLADGLRDTDGIQIFLNFKDESECPLFVPILVEGGKRDALRKYLIDQKIYLPVHWPLSRYHRGILERGKRIYKEELSLVCDQRYGKKDMHRIVDGIKEFMSR